MRARACVGVLLHCSVLVLSKGSGAAAQDPLPPSRSARHLESLGDLESALWTTVQDVVDDGVSREVVVEVHGATQSSGAVALVERLRAVALEAMMPSDRTRDRAGDEEGDEEGDREGATRTLNVSVFVNAVGVRVTASDRAIDPSWWQELFGWALRERRWEVALDPELRHFVAPRRRVVQGDVRPRSFRLPHVGYLAVAPWRPESTEEPWLVAVRRNGVDVMALRTRGNRIHAHVVASLERPPGELPGVTSQRPIATIAEAADGVRVEWRDRQGAYRLRNGAGGPTLEVTERRCGGVAHDLGDVCAEPVDGRDYFASELIRREGGSRPARAPTSFYTRWSQRVRRADGSVGSVTAVISPRGRLVVRTDQREVGLAGHGAALGVGDLDGDGELEILVSDARESGPDDQLTLLRVTAEGVIHRIDEFRVEGGVMVAGAGDVDGDGVDELLAIAEHASGVAKLWLVE